jgi:predicted nucleotidyltransferase
MNSKNRLSNNDQRFAGVGESFYIETQEGMFFAVKGREHPDDRFIAVLRYAPDPERGDRTRQGVSYRRLYHFPEQEKFLRAAYPQYLAHDPVFQTTLQSVPKSSILRIYDPRRRLQELAVASTGSAFENDALALLRLLQNEAQVPLSALGITGSMLIGLHTEHSDLDVVVIGSEHCTKVHQALHRMLDAQSCAELRRLDSEGVKELFAQRIADTYMPLGEFAKLEKRKVNQGNFRERTYFIRFIKDAAENGEIYGSLRYTPLGRAKVVASIADDRESIFTPCKYYLSNARILERPQVADLNEITSFRGRFCEQARTGELVYAAGTLERVENNRGSVYHRLLLGNFPEDTLESSRLSASEL